MDDTYLRSTVPGDAEALVALWATAGENRHRPADRVDLVLRLVGRDPDAVILAELDGRIVGTVIAGWDGWRAHLCRLVVHPDQRGRGLAQRLLSAAEARLVALGAERGDAMVLEENTSGQARWTRMGYRPQEGWSRWVRWLRDADDR